MSDRCHKCNNIFKPKNKVKDKLDIFYCKDCAEDKRKLEKLQNKISKFIARNPFKKYNIEVIQDDEKNPIRIIIDFTK